MQLSSAKLEVKRRTKWVTSAAVKSVCLEMWKSKNPKTTQSLEKKTRQKTEVDIETSNEKKENQECTVTFNK